jgi:8-oxo-dGTP pyrophosphatase MutT (NUDIX family)
MATGPMWPCVAQARDGAALQRVPLWCGAEPIGSVAAEHIDAVLRFTALLRWHGGALHLLTTDAQALTQAFLTANSELRAQGLVRGWRDEAFTIHGPDSGTDFGRIERAATRFWGLLTWGAHCNGLVRDANGPIAQLWLGQRAASKSVDPNQWDNLIGAGVGAGQSPLDALLREAWEEAGLQPAQIAGVRPGRVVQMLRAIPEGLQFERLACFDVELPARLSPKNQDGEVQGFECLPVEQALRRAASGAMTVDSALVTLDFAERHGLLAASKGTEALWAGPSPMHQNPRR